MCGLNLTASPAGRISKVRPGRRIRKTTWAASPPRWARLCAPTTRSQSLRWHQYLVNDSKMTHEVIYELFVEHLIQTESSPFQKISAEFAKPS